MPHTAILEKTSIFLHFFLEMWALEMGTSPNYWLKNTFCHFIDVFQSGKRYLQVSSTPFNHSCNNRGKDRVLPTFGPRSIFGAFQLRFDYRLVEGGVGYTYSYPKHLLLRGPHLLRAMYSHPYLSISVPVYIQCQCKNLKLISRERHLLVQI